MNATKIPAINLGEQNIPMLTCDKELNITAINKYIADSGAFGEIKSLYAFSPENFDLLNEAKSTLLKSLPFYSTNFVINLTKTTISVIPSLAKTGEFDFAVCTIYLDNEQKSLNLTQSNGVEKLHSRYISFAKRIMNRLPILAQILEPLENSDGLDFLNDIANDCYAVIRNSMLAVSYHDLINHQADYALENIHLNLLLDRLLSAIRLSVALPDFELEYKLASQPMVVFCDSNYLTAALMHIISNSLMHAPKGSCIKVNADVKGDAVIITISDEGDGIEACDLDKIYNPFFSGSETPDSRGVGLGLSVAKLIIESFGGTIFISSEYCKGTITAIRLPVSDMPSEGYPIKHEAAKYVSDRLSDLYVYFSEIHRFTFY